MRVLHVGLGDFGIQWQRLLMRRKDIKLVGVVDKDSRTFDSLCGFSGRRYTSLELALDVEKPEFVFNATPPHAHMEVNRSAFSRNIPVLTEKPISEDPAEVLECLQYAKDGQKLMVAENYRYLLQNRFVKEQIDARLRNIVGINLVFRKYHQVENYHKNMQHPMLIDVGIHHLDLLRYFTDKEAIQVYARMFTPAWSWYTGYSNVRLLAEMEGGAFFIYDGSLDARDPTDWNGNWTFSAENGLCRYEGDKLYWNIDGKLSETDVPQEEDGMERHRMLDDFITYVKGGVRPITDITDQVKTFAIVFAALLSTERGCAVQVGGII